MIKKTGNIICIKNFKNENCLFLVGKIYKASYDITRSYNDFYNIRLYENKNKYISFDLNSTFNKKDITEHFIYLQELRKKKLDKLNNL